MKKGRCIGQKLWSMPIVGGVGIHLTLLHSIMPLMNYPKLFVRVDAGTYALVDWGFSQVDTYPDMIASTLQSSKMP